MAILELVVNQKLNNQLVVNRYHYVSSGTPAAVSLSFALCHATGYLATRLSAGLFPLNSLARQIAGYQGGAVSYLSAYARNLYSVTDFYEAPFPTNPVGARSGETMSPVVAYGFYSSRVRTDIRRGSKRIAGPVEGDVGAMGVLESNMVTALTTVSAKMSEVLTYDDEGNTISFTPAVLGLDEYTTPGGRRAYRPYPTEPAQLNHLATGMTWSPYTTVRTQVSRQYGRGA